MKLHLGYLLGLSAIIVAACAAFFSVYGLSQLFAGASIAVIVMATALEVSKLIAASFLHRYWTEISKILRVYLTIGVVVLVTITSAGIYGFLTNAYQKTANSLMVHEGEVNLLDGKIDIFKKKIENNESLIESKNKRITQLSELRQVQEVRLDSMINRRYFSNANATRDEIEKANAEIQNLQNEVDLVTVSNNKLNDSINKYEIQKLDLVSNSEVAAEVGPLKYMSELTGKPMDEIVNYFVLLLIFVFDPMAVSLVIATGWVFKREQKKAEEKLNQPTKKEPTPEPKTEPEVKIEYKDYEVTEEDKEEIYKSFGEAVEEVLKEVESETKEEESETKEEDELGTMDLDVQSEIMERVEEDTEDSPQEVSDEPKATPKPKVPLKEDDIPEVKNRKKKFSVEIPKSTSNSIERIGGQKYLENKNTVVYRNKRNDR